MDTLMRLFTTFPARASQDHSSLAPYLHEYTGGNPGASPDFYNDLSLTPPPPPPSRPRSTTSSESSLSHVLLRPCSSYIAGRKLIFSQHFVATRCEDVRVDVQEAKRLQDWTLKVPESSDSIVRELTRVVKEQSNAIVGLSSLVDALYNTCSDLSNQLHRANASISKVARRKLPEGTKLCHDNLTRPWRIEANPPFKAHDLNALLEDWDRMKHVKDSEHYIQLVDFLRFYFVKATHPTPAIQSYSCRLTGKHAKNPDLVDLPHEIAHTLTEYLMSHPTEYWTKLGRDNDSRKAAFNLRKEYRSDWVHPAEGPLLVLSVTFVATSSRSKD
ncbi:hypothetical protein Aduo_018711 [Ancylostoma duodenale]